MFLAFCFHFLCSSMSLYRPLCLLGIDACIYRDMLK
jgi:hypothetical protein